MQTQIFLKKLSLCETFLENLNGLLKSEVLLCSVKQAIGLKILAFFFF